MNLILRSCCFICDKQLSKDFADDCQNNIVKFLTMPLETMSLTILQMTEYPNLMKYLPFPKRRLVASKIAQAVVTLRNILNSLELTKQLIKFINPLLVTEKDYVEVENFEFEEEQLSVAKLVHLIETDDLSKTLEILNVFKEKFLEGEMRRMKYTLPSFIFRLFKFLRDVIKNPECGVNIKEIVYGIKNLIDLLAKENQELSLRLYLGFALCINEFDQNKDVIINKSVENNLFN